MTPSIVDLHWPQGVVIVRFDSSELGATTQAEFVTRELGGHVVSDTEEVALTALLAASPWTGTGTVAAVALQPSRVVEFLSAMSATCDAIALRPLIGTGEVRFASEAQPVVTIAAHTAGGRLVVRRGVAIAAGDVEDRAALKARLKQIPNVTANPEPDVVIASFTPAGPVLAIRPYTSNDFYWQVYFDTNLAIREVLGDGTFPAPMPVFGIQQLGQSSTAAHA